MNNNKKASETETNLFETQYKDNHFITAKSYFEVLRKIFSHAEVEKLSVPCSLIYHDESLYPAVNIFSYCICCAKAEVIHYGQAIPFNH